MALTSKFCNCLSMAKKKTCKLLWFRVQLNFPQRCSFWGELGFRARKLALLSSEVSGDWTNICKNSSYCAINKTFPQLLNRMSPLINFCSWINILTHFKSQSISAKWYPCDYASISSQLISVGPQKRWWTYANIFCLFSRHRTKPCDKLWCFA